MKDQLTKIGVFYDGNYFLQVSNYYAYGHSLRRRISISGLHEFIQQQVANEENADVRRCKIVDAHYFRGRLNASEASQRGDRLYYDRVFEDILLSEGVTTHYLPVRMGYDGVRHEKGIDVWIAVEALELTYTKRFDVVVLIASDSDFVPLVRKMNALGSRVMILSWNFDYTGENGQRYITRTSQDLVDEASYPMPMHDLIDAGLKYSDPRISSLFVQNEQRRSYQPNAAAGAEAPAIELTGGEGSGEILSLKSGFGFIKFPPNNLFFHYSSLVDVEFTDLQVGDMVGFKLGKNDEGGDVAKEVYLISANEGNFNRQ